MTAQPTLLVVFGAGASWDVDPLGNYGGIRPPLTRDLFTSRDFEGERGQFSRLAGIMRKLVVASEGTSIEQTLAALQARADHSYAPAARELASVRYYLRDVLKRCTDSVLTQLHRATTYAEFVRRVDDWNCNGGQGWRVVLVSFNYDTLLEAACVDERRMRFDSIDDYIAGDWPVLKPHGSWTWVQEVTDERFPPATGGSYPTASRHDLIDDFIDLKLAEQIVVHRAHLSSPDADSVELMDEARTRVPVVPALTIPVMDKSRFVFPDSHLKCLRDACRDTAFLMTIGWHGQEHHFLKELAGAVSSTSMKCVIVTASEPGARVVQDTLQQHGITAEFTQHTGGFGTFLRDPDRLEGLLNAETADR